MIKNEFHGFGRFPLVAKLLISFWSPFWLIVVMKLRGSFFSPEE